VGRWDWWNLKAEHTPYEWAAQRALYEVAPWGERRADLRAAFVTANLMCSQSSQERSDEDFQAMVESLASYLKCDCDNDDEEADLTALERMKKGE